MAAPTRPTDRIAGVVEVAALEPGRATAWPLVGRRRVFSSLRTFESLRHRHFRWFFAALVAQFAAMNMQMVVNGYLVYELTGSFAALGLTSLASAVTMVPFSLVGGVLADRLPKRRVLQAGQLANLIKVFAIGLLLSFDMLRFEHLIIAQAIGGGLMALMMPSQQSAVPEIVGHNRLTNAVALSSAGMNSMRIIAPALGGVMLAHVGAEWIYYLMTGMWLLGMLALLKVPARPAAAAANDSAPAGRRHGGAADVREGFGYVRRDKTILTILVVSLSMTVFSFPYIMMLPGFAKDVLGAGPDRFGLLISISGIGSLVGSLTLASLSGRRRGLLMIVSSLLLGVSLLAFALSSVYWVAAVILGVVGIAQVGRMSLTNVLIQTYVTDAYRGRVSSMHMMEIGLMSLGTFAIGILASVIGVQNALAGMAVILIVISLGVLRFLPRLRDLD